MTRKKTLKLLFVCILLFMAALIGYKVYLLVDESDFCGLNADHIGQIEARLRGKERFRFAVVGNVKNSMQIFEQRIVPLMKEKSIDFIISAGNAVYDGAEDKYRLLYRGFRKLGIPYVLAAGPNEVEDFGAGKFYRHFGPFFFSFHLKNAYFIFLDSTGKTSWKWQERWLRQELAMARQYAYRFVVLSHSLFPMPGFDADDPRIVLEESRRRSLQRLFSQYRVTAVFSAGYPTYKETVMQGVRYIVSGGGGGLLLGRQEEHYQYVMVNVEPRQLLYQNVAVPYMPDPVHYKLEIMWLFIHSFFYIGLFNFLVALAIISLVALKVYSLIIRQEHFYRDFSIDEEELSKAPLRVVMFTNNYLPFLGGVPLSIDRLYRGLARSGATVKVFAPEYAQQWSDPEDGSIFRCASLFHTGPDKFPIPNILSRKINAAFKAFACDLVHVHHPFWLGKKGMRLGKGDGVPVVLTYHTRLERYTHYIPLPGAALKALGAHFLIKRFANKCDAVITPTSSTEEYLRNLGVSSLIETIPTGINLDDYARWSPQQIHALRGQYVDSGERLLISVSRMAKEKNLDFLLDGLVKVRNRTETPFKCLLVGGGPEKSRLEAKVVEAGMDERIVFAGNMSPRQVIGYYLAADLFVFASTSETQGMVLLEAMAGGCPVVAVRASGVYDVIKDGYNGYKVPESTESWARAVASLLEDSQRLRTLSENSQTFAENYSLEKITQKVLRLYRRVLVLNQSESGK